MELNTTQYLAILASLKTPGQIISQIDTGEGKSRIMMITLACYHALGKTVDFITSDISLATRDFVAFQPFFEMMGAKTAMIFATSPASTYQIGGINFSDRANKSLFNNTARSLGLGEQVSDPDPKKRAVMIDEVDKTLYDSADKRFNVAEDNQALEDMLWVYPLLIDYFVQEQIDGNKPLDLYCSDVDQCRKAFIDFASGRCNAEQFKRLRALADDQLDQWQVAAVTAMNLKFGHNFVIKPDDFIRVKSGLKIASKAQFRSEGRVAENSTFSFGTQQCLHAYLNYLRQNIHLVGDQSLKTALQECTHDFHIDGEKQIVYSSTSKDLLDEYKDGVIKGVTGTPGSALERQEAGVLYDQHFITVPRDKPMRRRDRGVYLTANKKQQLAELITQIKAAQAKNQPILLVVKDDVETALLYDQLKEIFPEKIQRVHSQLSIKQENDCIEQAGNAGFITVATDMIGRGVDIRLKGNAKKQGLKVLLTYLPRVRDMIQIFGRAARFGDYGETSLVLEKEELQRTLGKKSLTEFYKNAEAFMVREQALMDRNQQCERLIKYTVGSFRKQLTERFFETVIKDADAATRKQLIPIWSAYNDQLDKLWNEQWPGLYTILVQNKLHLSTDINQGLHQYGTAVYQEWLSFLEKLRGAGIEHDLATEINPLTLDDATKNLLDNFDASKHSASKLSVYDHYERGHDGRAVRYSNWSISLRASLKGWANLLPGVNFEDARPPFANFRAWRAGRGVLFPNWRASTNKGKILGGLLGGLFTAALGVALIATGVLAPLGISFLGLSVVLSSAVLFGVAGGVVGGVLGIGIGAGIDKVNAPMSVAMASVEERRLEVFPEADPVSLAEETLEQVLADEAQPESAAQELTESHSGSVSEPEPEPKPELLPQQEEQQPVLPRSKG